MAQTYVGGIQLVIASKEGFRPQHWAVAIPRDEALDFIQKQLPGWNVKLSVQHLTPAQVAKLELRPGEAREVHK